VTRASRLYRLQTLDQERDALKANLVQVKGVLGSRRVLEEAEASNRRAREMAAAARTQLKSKELELESLTSKLRNIEEQMYGGRVRNPKELAGLEQEAAHLKKAQGELEEAVLLLMEEAEARGREEAQTTRALEAVSAAWQKEQMAITEEHAALVARLTALTEQIDALRVEIEPDDLAIYDGLRRRPGARAVAHLVEGACEHCGVSLSSGLAQRVGRGQEALTCPECGVILFAER